MVNKALEVTQGQLLQAKKKKKDHLLILDLLPILTTAVPLL